MTGGPGPLLRMVPNQKLAFLVVGGANTAMATAWFIFWEIVTGPHLGYHFSIVAGYVCNVLTAFFTYRFLVFRVRGHVLSDLGRFFVVNFGAFVVNLLLMTVAVSGFGLPQIPSQLVITAVLAVAQYFGYREFSFKRHGTPATGTGAVEAHEGGGT